MGSRSKFTDPILITTPPLHRHFKKKSRNSIFIQKCLGMLCFDLYTDRRFLDGFFGFFFNSKNKTLHFKVLFLRSTELSNLQSITGREFFFRLFASIKLVSSIIEFFWSLANFWFGEQRNEKRGSCRRDLRPLFAIWQWRSTVRQLPTPYKSAMTFALDNDCQLDREKREKDGHLTGFGVARANLFKFVSHAK